MTAWACPLRRFSTHSLSVRATRMFVLRTQSIRRDWMQRISAAGFELITLKTIGQPRSSQLLA